MSKYVVHCKHNNYDVYIGRPSKWKNPFKIGKDGTRAQVIDKFRAYIFARPALLRKVREELAGKTLGCWCYPKACHGDVLAEIANVTVERSEG